MKTKLFSLKSLLTSVKGLVSSIITGMTEIPFYILIMFLIRHQLVVVAGVVGLFAFTWYLLFWGFISEVLWHGWRR